MFETAKLLRASNPSAERAIRSNESAMRSAAAAILSSPPGITHPLLRVIVTRRSLSRTCGA